MEKAWRVLSEGELPKDRRLEEIKRLDMPLELRNYSKRKWLRRMEEIKRHILFVCGLLPEPERTPLNTEIFGRGEREGYSIEKAFFESHPGFYVTGNIYRPLTGGTRPGILCPHGHWSNGRLAEEVQTRCINLARQGHVVFSYDMVGYNDSSQVSHDFGGPKETIWGVSLMGLQLWNSIRAIDFLQSLEDVDSERIGCTGASGGATQTFMVSAVDTRVKVSAPVCMVSAHFQGGCLCENAPSLRLDTNNVEIAALMAPRPMLLVSATGDWTRRTPWVEYPFIERIYGFFGAVDKVDHVQVNAPHNYNKESREAVYGWFGKWLLGVSDPERLRERPCAVEKSDALLVFHDRERPKNAVDPEGLMAYFVSSCRSSLEELKPRDEEGLEEFRRVMEGAMGECLSVDPAPIVNFKIRGKRTQIKPKVRLTRALLNRKGTGEGIPAILLQPSRSTRKGVLVVYEEGKARLFDGQGFSPLVSGLLSLGYIILSVDCFLTGEYTAPVRSRKEIISCDMKYYETYNRTDVALRVQDILTSLSLLRSSCRNMSLIGFGEAGVWGLLASSMFKRMESVVVDLNQFAEETEEHWMKRLYVPGVKKVGGLRTAASLNAPKKLLIHNVGRAFDVDWIKDFYRILSAENNLDVFRERLGHDAILNWLTKKH